MGQLAGGRESHFFLHYKKAGNQKNQVPKGLSDTTLADQIDQKRGKGSHQPHLMASNGGKRTENEGLPQGV